MILAEHYQAVLDGTMTPEQATEAAIADITSREGAVNGFLDALGVAGGVAAGVPACGSGILTAGCIAAAAATAASGNHLYADVRQVITGKEAKTAVVDALVAMGMDPAKAATYEHYADIGAIVVTLGAGGYAFAVNKIAAGKAATVLEGLEGKTFGGAKGGARLTIRDQYAYHKAMVDDLKAQLESQGYQVSDKEIFIWQFLRHGALPSGHCL